MDIIAGTAGHIDHGKTALVKALTGIDADRLPEEQKRGITIDIGFAELDLEEVRIGFVDVPGHEKFVKNMLAGASGIDLVLLVIAADEGVMPQTREHFEICRLLETPDSSRSRKRIWSTTNCSNSSGWKRPNWSKIRFSKTLP
jgi:selenocysteine-specific elongation factor